VFDTGSLSARVIKQLRFEMVVAEGMVQKASS
jgi:hypothetical protein